MPRPAQPLVPPHQAVLRPHPEEALRPPAERAWLIAVWAGAFAFSLAFWTAVTLLLAR